MKKRIIRTLVTMGLAVSVIMPGAQGLAQEMQSVEMRKNKWNVIWIMRRRRDHFQRSVTW